MNGASSPGATMVIPSGFDIPEAILATYRLDATPKETGSPVLSRTAANRYVAKSASGRSKPDGITIVSPGEGAAERGFPTGDGGAPRRGKGGAYVCISGVAVA
ncbi:hypothetical protein AGMMS49944_20290 [Spirochaetia bacterium]|nr:hypothetical protein AGMMS49944_20290 [Spirochaetia bacterium]